MLLSKYIDSLNNVFSRREQIVLAVVFALSFLLRVLLAREAPATFGYVYDFYHEAIQQYHETGELPESDDCWQCYHPPIYPVLGWIVYSLSMAATEGDVDDSLEYLAILSIPLSYVFILVCFLVLRCFVNDSSHLLALACLLLMLPLVFISSFAIESDLLCATFMLSAFYLYLRYRQGADAWWRVILMGVLAGLGAATKYSGLTMPAVIATLMACALRGPDMRRRALQLLVFGGCCFSVGGWHYVNNLWDKGTLIVGNQAWDKITGEEEKHLYLDVYTFTDFDLPAFTDVLRPDSPQRTLREIPVYNQNVLTSLYGQLWTDGSIFSNPWRHGLQKSLYPFKAIPIPLVGALLWAGLIPILLAGLGLVRSFCAPRENAPLYLLTIIILGLYLRWILGHAEWMLKTKYLFCLLPVILIFCSYGLRVMRACHPWAERGFIALLYVVTTLSAAYCLYFAIT
ncbi:MAG: hypothetical protein EOM20_16930 [Spartobacteria bacterium]|nr:hypothetical protein [Spartobacteria bacterium]